MSPRNKVARYRISKLCRDFLMYGEKGASFNFIRGAFNIGIICGIITPEEQDLFLAIAGTLTNKDSNTYDIKPEEEWWVLENVVKEFEVIS